MLQYSNCKIGWQHSSVSHLKKKIAKTLHIKESDFLEFHIVKKSLDARRKPDLVYLYSVIFSVAEEEKVLRTNRNNKNLSVAKKQPSLQQEISDVKRKERVIIVGAGPAGLFCAYYLSLCGLKPVILEQGAPVEERVREVEKFWEEGILSPNSNISFGEGGAGTFSDGKLNTGVKDKTGKKQFVLESFVRFGAPEHILYDSKPHIGTDVLQKVIMNMRKEMIEKGCEFHFYTKMTDLILENHFMSGIRYRHIQTAQEGQFFCQHLVLAIGHSARDTFSMLCDNRVFMSPKAFAVGVRVQHRQEDIDRAQYGFIDSALPASPYKCTGKTEEGRGVYSFCMCPGGYVVNASTEENGLVVNGMSDSARDSGNANSAIVVTVGPEDFEGDDVLAGVRFQRKWEQEVYGLCAGKIPVQRYEDFCQGTATVNAGKVQPCVKGKWAYANLQKALPKDVKNGIIDGMRQFGRKLEGFDDKDTLLMGIETRTSSPVRMDRDENFVSISTAGLYPCGEGAGYAGGIMSAAMDGIRVAMKIQERCEE